MTDEKKCRCVVGFQPDAEPVIKRNGCPLHLTNDPILRDEYALPGGFSPLQRSEQYLAASVAARDNAIRALDAEVASRPIQLQCAACIQDARNLEAAGQPMLPILPAVTVVNGLALCDVEGRHRIMTPAQAMAQQASGLLLPQPGQQLPPMNGFGRPNGN